MGWTADKTGKSGAETAGADTADAGSGTGRGGAKSKRGIAWILAGLVVTGLVAGYSWLRKLPR
jgi:hypothetical protein